MVRGVFGKELLMLNTILETPTFSVARTSTLLYSGRV
jgi:hypothetical protein